MAEITREYFDTHYEELVEYLGKQFAQLAPKDHINKGLTELRQTIQVRFDFFEIELKDIKQSIKEARKQAVEDTNELSRNYLKLLQRVTKLEEQIKKLKTRQSA